MIKIPTRPPGSPNSYTEEQIVKEFIKCKDPDLDSRYGFIYWLTNYCRIYNNDEREFVQFEPWQSERALEEGYDDQVSVARKMQRERQIICLKARQIGQTTLVLAYFLYEALYNPAAFILLLSRGELEAKELLLRIKTMYDKLPFWMKSDTLSSSKTEWRLTNGSAVLSLSSRRGDSYSATHVLIDEAALLYRSNISLQQVLLNLAPTIGGKGKLFIISKIDKGRPLGTFNTMYKAAYDGKSDYVPVFVPYYVVPNRDDQWYADQCETSLSMDGTLDYVYESFPATPDEALSPRSADKRLLYAWLRQCYFRSDPLEQLDLPLELIDIATINGLKVYKQPEEYGSYIITADPSEGINTSDPSSIHVVNVETREECAVFAGSVEPSVLGGIIDKLGHWYNRAPVLFELNEHGHALKLWLRDHSELSLLKGWSKTAGTRKIGWDQNSYTKPLMYDMAARRLMEGKCIIHNPKTFDELASIESSTLRAPQKLHDDQATTYALALAGIELCMTEMYDIAIFKVATH